MQGADFLLGQIGAMPHIAQVADHMRPRLFIAQEAAIIQLAFEMGEEIDQLLFIGGNRAVQFHHAGRRLVARLVPFIADQQDGLAEIERGEIGIERNRQQDIGEAEIVIDEARAFRAEQETDPGASRDLPPATRLAWIRAMREALEREGMGWALWGYDDSMGFGLRPGPGARLDPDLLAALGLHAGR